MDEISKVIFVCDFGMRTSQRVSKLALMLRSRNIDVILIHHDQFPPEDPGLFTEIHEYCYLDQVLGIIKDLYPGNLFHVFSSWHLYVAYELIKDKPGRIIFDNYDCLKGFINDEFLDREYPHVLEAERFCLENADALCCRNMETQYLKRQFNYKFRFKRLYMPDGCSSSKTRNESSRAHHKGGYVFAGGMLSGKMDFFDNWHCQVGLHLSKAKLHYHIYPSNSISEEYKGRLADFINRYSEAAYFHIHEPLPYSDLMDELTEYKYGMYFVKVDKVVETPVRQFYGWGNKLYDYLEAGLLTISDSPQGAFMSWIIRRYKMGRIVNGANDISFDAAEENNVEIPRIFTPEFNGPRLVDFYREVMEHDYEMDEIYDAMLGADRRFARSISIIKKIFETERNNPEAMKALRLVLNEIKRPDLAEKLQKRV
ncbi:MAG: hypothetical protein HF314_05745 [Ignavibacteria bacterium]|nr:hypothetical protein [Ignavibacteria bacterium]MCU7502554.1 hypothetical protein [Ignavibacteria bacterium]MCU7515243.1 hypothetical protein [Ignavibacteria bacterium]